MEQKEKTIRPEEFKTLIASQEGEFIIHVKFEKEGKNIGRKPDGTA